MRLIGSKAQNYSAVSDILRREKLPVNGEFLVSKGIAFCVDHPEKPEDEYRQIIETYLKERGFVVAFGWGDIELAKKYPSGDSVEALSPGFKRLLGEWKKIESAYPCPIPTLGFWRATDVAVYQKH